MADSRGFKSLDRLWQNASATDQDSECFHEELAGRSQNTDRPAGAAAGQGEEEEQQEEENVGGSRRSLDFGVQVGDSSDFWGESGREHVVARGGTIPRSRTDSGARSRSGSVDRRLSDRARQRDFVRVEEERYAVRRSHVESGTGAVLQPSAAIGHKLTRGRASISNTVAHYLQSGSTNASAAHYHRHHHHHELHGQYPPGRTTGRQHRHHHSSRGSYSNETQEEVQEDDEATLRELLVRYVRYVRARVSSPSLGPSVVGVYHSESSVIALSIQLPYHTTSRGRRIVVRSFVDLSIRYEPLDGTIITFSPLVLRGRIYKSIMHNPIITSLSYRL